MRLFRAQKLWSRADDFISVVQALDDLVVVGMRFTQLHGTTFILAGNSFDKDEYVVSVLDDGGRGNNDDVALASGDGHVCVHLRLEAMARIGKHNADFEGERNRIDRIGNVVDGAVQL